MPKNNDNEKVNSRRGVFKRARGVWKGVKRIFNRSQNRENERTTEKTSEKESLNSPYLSLDMPNPNIFEDVNDFYNTRPTIDSLRELEEFKDEEVTNVGEVKEAHISQNLSDYKEELLEVCKNLKNHLESNQKALEHREKNAYTDEDKEKINTFIKDNEFNISKINDFIDSITNGTDSFDASEIKFQTQVLTAWENRTLKQQDIFIEDFFLKAEAPHFSPNFKLPNTNLFEDVNDFYNKIDNEANMAQVDSRIQYSKSRIEGINSYLDENKNAIGYKNYKNELNQVATKLENLEDNWNRESDTSVFYTNYVELNNSINELKQKVFPNISVEDFNEINEMAVELTDITKKGMDEYKQGRRRIRQLEAILKKEAGKHFFIGDFEGKTREYNKEIKNLRTIRNNAQNIHREYSQYEEVNASSEISNHIIEPFVYIDKNTKNILDNDLRTINEEYTNIVG